MTAALIAAALLSLLYWLRYCHATASWPKSAVKTGAVLLLALAAWLAGGPAMLVAALLLCALGDYLLSRDSEAQFMAGIGAFAAGHIAYVALFLAHATGGPGALPLSIAYALSAALLLLGLIMARLLWARAGALRVPVMAYIPVILAMGLAATLLPFAGPLALVLPGALLFIASDFTLALEMFVLPEDHRLRRAAPFIVWPSYWGAQLLFTLAFCLPMPA